MARTLDSTTLPLRALAALTALGVLVAAVALGFGERVEAAAVSTQPNIVFIQTDDQTLCSVIDADFCPKKYKQAMPKTIKLLAKEGTTFDTYFATHPRCCPSRASYLTGMYSHNHGILSNKHGYGRFSYHGEALPVWLKNAGYATAHIGKYMNGYFGRFADQRPVPPGWDDWFASVDEGTYHMFNWSMMLRSDMPVRDLEGNTLAEPTAEPRRVRFGNRPEDYQTDVEAAIAVDYINAQQANTSPFFLAINPLAPHSEHIGFDRKRNPRPAPRHENRFRKAKVPRGPSFNEKDVDDKPKFISKKPELDKEARDFIELRYRSQLESLLAVDDLVERVYRALANTGQLENTVIVFTSDNGFMAGEHRLKAGKVALYDEAVHVPLIIRGPGFPSGARREQLVGNIDLAPTFADLAGARPLTKVDGISLLDYAGNPSLDTGRAILLENGVDGSRGVRDGNFTYIDNDSGKELYDNKKDPYELESLHDDKRFKDILGSAKKRLKHLKNCAGSGCLE